MAPQRKKHVTNIRRTAPLLKKSEENVRILKRREATISSPFDNKSIKDNVTSCRSSKNMEPITSKSSIKNALRSSSSSGASNTIAFKSPFRDGVQNDLVQKFVSQVKGSAAASLSGCPGQFKLFCKPSNIRFAEPTGRGKATSVSTTVCSKAAESVCSESNFYSQSISSFSQQSKGNKNSSFKTPIRRVPVCDMGDSLESTIKNSVSLESTIKNSAKELSLCELKNCKEQPNCSQMMSCIDVDNKQTFEEDGIATKRNRLSLKMKKKKRTVAENATFADSEEGKDLRKIVHLKDDDENCYELFANAEDAIKDKTQPQVFKTFQKGAEEKTGENPKVISGGNRKKTFEQSLENMDVNVPSEEEFLPSDKKQTSKKCILSSKEVLQDSEKVKNNKLAIEIPCRQSQDLAGNRSVSILSQMTTKYTSSVTVDKWRSKYEESYLGRESCARTEGGGESCARTEGYPEMNSLKRDIDDFKLKSSFKQFKRSTRKVKGR